PYFHHITETNTSVPLSVGHDFEYIYIDKDHVQIEADNMTTEDDENRRIEFAIELFKKRAQISGGIYKETNLVELLGHSILLDHKRESDWSPDSENMKLLKKYCDETTIKRAEKLLITPERFMNEIGRKIYGALLLRNAVETQRGAEILDVYSGFTMAVRCADSNPRRLIRIFNRFILHSKLSKNMKTFLPLEPKKQTNLLKGFSTITLNRVHSEPVVGSDLLTFLETIGNFMKNCFYNEPLSTDQTYSIKVDKNTSEKDWKIIKHAVGIGLLYPNVSVNNPDQIPEIEGIFRLAYVLAPHFDLLPRRGKCRNLTAIKNFPYTLKTKVKQKSFFEINEKTL
ncbi:MAG: hypothetical protein KGQ83_09795, partial [Planctomycetes bacterium]|nr:hypothetical protein [Planctomycetota bacterium]